jgi:hypothetical protein
MNSMYPRQDRGACGIKGMGSLLLSALVVLSMVTTGCFAAKLAKGEKGTDVTGIQPGVKRANAEAILGPPVRDWTSPTGIRYSTYYYDAGVPPSIPDAAAFALMDLISGGIFELMATTNGFPLHHTTDGMVISYNDRAVVLGIFDEFDELPPDGRSNPRKWKRALPESEK